MCVCLNNEDKVLKTDKKINNTNYKRFRPKPIDTHRYKIRTTDEKRKFSKIQIIEDTCNTSQGKIINSYNIKPSKTDLHTNLNKVKTNR